MGEENVAKMDFLWKAIQLIPQKNESSHILQCHLMSKCRDLHRTGKVYLPGKYTQKSSMCQFCSNIWKNGKYTIMLEPEKIPTKSIKKILVRYATNPRSLRKFEVGLAKKYVRRKNTLVINCGVCQRDTKLDLIKPEKKEHHVEASSELQKKKKKKKWVKDPTAGLNIPANMYFKGTSIENSVKQNCCHNERGLVKSEFSVKKKNESNNGNKSVSAEDVGRRKVNNKKQKNQLADSSVHKNKKVSRLKIVRKPDVLQNNEKIKMLIKNKKIGNILNNSGKLPESPLSRFLSNL